MMKLGELLVANNVISERNLLNALEKQYTLTEPTKLGEILINQGLLTETMLIHFLGQQLGLRVIETVNVNDVIQEALPERVCRDNTCIVVSREGESILILASTSDGPDLREEYDIQHCIIALAKVSTIRQAMEAYRSKNG
jgi:MSHA biogenesis protein MshE